MAPQQLDSLDPQQMRQALLSLMTQVAAKDELLERRQREVAFKQAQVDKLTHELAILKRLKFAATSEKFCAGMSAEQRSLLEETLDADIAQACAEIERTHDEKGGGKDKKDKQIPKREPLPAHLPRRDVNHEPDSTVCACGCQMKRIGQDVSEKLDYEPGVFTVDRHVRGKWACAHCQKLVQAPVAAHIIDKGTLDFIAAVDPESYSFAIDKPLSLQFIILPEIEEAEYMTGILAVTSHLRTAECKPMPLSSTNGR